VSLVAPHLAAAQALLPAAERRSVRGYPEMKLHMNGIVALLSVFYLVGFGLLGYGLWNARRSTKAAAWPSAPATITHLAIETRTNRGMSYELKVRYTYTVDGRVYEGDRLALGYAGSGGRAAHAEIQRTLSRAKNVAVRYDPSNPAVACLSFGLHRSIQLMLAFSLMWLSFVIGFTVVCGCPPAATQCCWTTCWCISEFDRAGRVVAHRAPTIRATRRASQRYLRATRRYRGVPRYSARGVDASSWQDGQTRRAGGAADIVRPVRVVTAQ
jgi:hypothetical protein